MSGTTPTTCRRAALFLFTFVRGVIILTMLLLSSLTRPSRAFGGRRYIGYSFAQQQQQQQQQQQRSSFIYHSIPQQRHFSSYSCSASGTTRLWLKKQQQQQQQPPSSLPDCTSGTGGGGGPRKQQQRRRPPRKQGQQQQQRLAFSSAVLEESVDSAVSQDDVKDDKREEPAEEMALISSLLLAAETMLIQQQTTNAGHHTKNITSHSTTTTCTDASASAPAVQRKPRGRPRKQQQQQQQEKLLASSSSSSTAAEAAVSSSPSSSSSSVLSNSVIIQDMGEEVEKYPMMVHTSSSSNGHNYNDSQSVVRIGTAQEFLLQSEYGIDTVEHSSSVSSSLLESESSSFLSLHPASDLFNGTIFPYPKSQSPTRTECNDVNGTGQQKRGRPRKQQQQQQQQQQLAFSSLLENSVGSQNMKEPKQEEVKATFKSVAKTLIQTSIGHNDSHRAITDTLEESPPPVTALQKEEVVTEKHEHQSSISSSSSSSTSTSLVESESEEPVLLHPCDLFNGTIPYPKSLSPSSILEFQKCPQSFLFQYLYMLKQPTTPTLAKGSLCHEALEQIFDLSPEQRTLQHLQNLFRTAWSRHKNTAPSTTASSSSSSNNYQDLFVNDLEAEVAWGREGLQLLENYYLVEDPRTVTRPNPVHRERWIRADLPVDPTKGATGYLQVSNRRHDNDDVDDDIILNNGNDAPKETFLVRGIIDRLDMIHAPSVTASSTASSSNNDNSSRRRRDSSVVLRLVDYKTGKAPHLKYSHAMNMKIIHEAFYQLKIYALLWRQQQQLQLQQQQATLCSTSDPYGDASLNSTLLSTTPVDTGIDLRFLRLFFLTSTPKDLPNVHEHNSAGSSSGSSNMGPAKFLDMDLGETPEQRDHVLQQVHVDLSRIWNEIVELVSLQDAKAWKGCTRSFCYCHTCRARFVPGTVWEPSPTTPPKAKSSSS